MNSAATVNSYSTGYPLYSAGEIAGAPVDAASLSEQHEAHTLPPPLATPSSDFDLVSLIMALNEKIGQRTTERSETNLRFNQDKLKKTMDELNSKMQEAMKQAAEAERKHDRKGFFGAIGDAISAAFKAIGEVIGAVIGTVADFVVDIATQPYDLIKGLLKGKNLEDLLNQEFDEMTTNGAIAKTVEDCAKGVFAFVGDLVNFGNTLMGALEAGVKGQDVGELLKGECEAVLDSLKQNILNNPAVMKVVGVVLKVAAIAAMALGTVSFGVGAVVAVGLLALAELNEQTGLAKKIAGEKVGAWIGVGLQLAATVVSMVFLGGAGAQNVKSSLETAQAVSVGGAILQGASATSIAYEQYKSANKEAKAADQQADLSQILFRMQRLQREGDSIIESLEGETKSLERNRRIGSQLVETQALTQQAAVMHA